MAAEKLGLRVFYKKKKHDFQPRNTLRTPLEPTYQPIKPKK